MCGPWVQNDPAMPRPPPAFLSHSLWVSEKRIKIQGVGTAVAQLEGVEKLCIYSMAMDSLNSLFPCHQSHSGQEKKSWGVCVAFTTRNCSGSKGEKPLPRHVAMLQILSILIPSSCHSSMILCFLVLVQVAAMRVGRYPWWCQWSARSVQHRAICPGWHLRSCVPWPNFCPGPGLQTLLFPTAIANPNSPGALESHVTSHCPPKAF